MPDVISLNTAEHTHNNRLLESQNAHQRIAWALTNLPDTHVISSSFGIQAAVSLHLVNQVAPGIPVILIDTGYLFPQTYQFIDELSTKLNLNMHIYRAKKSSAWQEARYGKQWEQGQEGLKRYHQINKIEPMQRALQNLNAGTWFAGLRRQQSDSRAKLPVLSIQKTHFKLHPIIDWHNRDVHQYLTQYQLPYHPLWEQGYVSVGDVHSSRPLQAGMREQDTRFHGTQRECGLHL